jgi:predicted MPP superfamily phosphohydrolase
MADPLDRALLLPVLPFELLRVLYLAAGFALAWLAARIARRQPRSAATALSALGLATLLGMLAASGILARGPSLFACVGLLASGVFVVLPAYGIACALWLRASAPKLAGTCAAGALALLAVGAWASRVEPRRLEIVRHRVASAELAESMDVAVIADLQTDRVGPHERAALEAAMAARPDLILLAGDYLHAFDGDYERLSAAFRDLWRELDVDAPLGVYAVEGNCEGPGWERLFEGLPVRCLARTETLDLGPLVLTGLSFSDGFDPEFALESPPGRFHVALAHAPDFSLGDPRADLLIAGHTHGGQVQLPFLGPLITLSRVPREQAAGGLFELAGDRQLIVSRGIGMERGYAPRIRFLCRPEVTIVHLEPSSAQTARR